MKSTHDRDSGYDAGVHNADDVSSDDQTCPRCGKAIHAIQTRGPSDHRLSCGCRVGPLTVRELLSAEDQRALTDGGQEQSADDPERVIVTVDVLPDGGETTWDVGKRVKELLQGEDAEPFEDVLCERSREVESDADRSDENPDLITDGGQQLDTITDPVTCLLCGRDAAHCSCCTDDDPDGPSVTATVDGGEIVQEATDADVRAAVTNSEVSA